MGWFLYVFAVKFHLLAQLLHGRFDDFAQGFQAVEGLRGHQRSTSG